MLLQFDVLAPTGTDGADLVIEGDVLCDGDFVVGSHQWTWSGGGGVVSLGDVSVFDADGSVELALSLVGFRAELATREVQRYGRRLVEAGLRVTHATRGRARD